MEKPTEGLLLLDKSLHIKTGNALAVALLEQPLTALIGKHIEELLPPESKFDTANPWENKHKITSGNLIMLYQPVSLPETGGIVILRNAAQESELDYPIQHCKKLLKELANPIDADPYQILITDGAGTTLEVITKNSEQLYGTPGQLFLGKNVLELEQKGFFFPSLVRLALDSGKQVTTIQETKTGRKLIASAQPVQNASGQITQVITVSREITDFYVLKKLIAEIEETMRHGLTDKADLLQKSNDLDGYIVKSPVMIDVLQNIRRIALFDSTILLLGETGTGKGALAKLLHKLGPRRKGAFVHVNSGAIPENLMESEFFGYMPGAFTGANKSGKKGLVELADHGILFLDEVDSLPPNLQAKLLHVIQDREFLPVGGTKKVKVDVRFIAATNKDLFKLVKEGKFREDLYYRLNVVPIMIPPLRERRDDILPIALNYLERLCKKYGVKRELSASAVSILLNYTWPGNVRELENVIERCAVTSFDSFICGTPGEISAGEGKVGPIPPPAESASSITLTSKVENMEKAVLEDALRKYGSTRKAAIHLGINQSTVVRKMKKYGLTSSNT